MTWDLGYVFFVQMQLVHIHNIFVSSLSATTSSIAYILLKFSDQKCVSKKKKCKQLIQAQTFVGSAGSGTAGGSSLAVTPTTS